MNFAVDYTIRGVQVNQDRSKLNGTHQLLVCDDDVKILGDSLRTVKENVETFVVANKKIGLEVNANKTKHMVISRDQNAGRSHSIMTDNRCLKGWKCSDIWENLENSKFYLGRYEAYVELRECLLFFGAESFVFQMVIQKIESLSYTEIYFAIC